MKSLCESWSRKAQPPPYHARGSWELLQKWSEGERGEAGAEQCLRGSHLVARPPERGLTPDHVQTEASDPRTRCPDGGLPSVVPHILAQSSGRPRPAN